MMYDCACTVKTRRGKIKLNWDYSECVGWGNLSSEVIFQQLRIRERTVTGF